MVHTYFFVGFAFVDGRFHFSNYEQHKSSWCSGLLECFTPIFALQHPHLVRVLLPQPSLAANRTVHKILTAHFENNTDFNFENITNFKVPGSLAKTWRLGIASYFSAFSVSFNSSSIQYWSKCHSLCVFFWLLWFSSSPNPQCFWIALRSCEWTWLL